MLYAIIGVLVVAVVYVIVNYYNVARVNESLVDQNYDLIDSLTNVNRRVRKLQNEAQDDSLMVEGLSNTLELIVTSIPVSAHKAINKTKGMKEAGFEIVRERDEFSGKLVSRLKSSEELVDSILAEDN